jgi:hypothetical protein
VLRLLIGAACILAVGAGVAVAASRLSAPQEKSAALQRLLSVATTDSSTDSADPPDSAPNPIPARMLGSDMPVPVSPSLLRVRNGWLVSDGRTLVAVYAGAAGDDPTVGRLVVIRQDLAAGRQTIRTVDAGATGALTIAAAPLGSSVETSAQTGSVRLQTAGGRVLRLDLRTEQLGGG